MSAVLVVRPSSLGDIVYALAVAADIRRHHPHLAIDWVAERGFVPLIEMCPEIRRVVPFALRRWRRSPLSRETWRNVGAFRRDLRVERAAAGVGNLFKAGDCLLVVFLGKLQLGLHAPNQIRIHGRRTRRGRHNRRRGRDLTPRGPCGAGDDDEQRESHRRNLPPGTR